MMNTYSTLNANTYGVQALSHSEMQEIDGGLIIMAGRLKRIAEFLDALETIWEFGEDVINGYKNCIK